MIGSKKRFSMTVIISLKLQEVDNWHIQSLALITIQDLVIAGI
jgi:hypothetical protein